MLSTLSRFLVPLCLLYNTSAQTGDDAHWSPQFGPPGGNRFVVAAHGADGQVLVAQNCSPETSCPLQFWDGTAWKSIGSLSGGLAIAQGLAHNGQNWYVGGSFTNAGGVSARNIAAWNGTAWSALGEGIAGYAGVLIIHQGTLYASGIADNGAQGAPLVARFNGNSWENLSSSFSASGSVYALASDGTNLFAAGYFQTPGRNVARYDGTGWTPLGEGLDGNVDALAIWNGELYASGSFTGGMAKWNGSQWINLGASFRPKPPTRLQAWKDGLYLAGDFTNINNQAMAEIARYDANGFQPLNGRVAGNVYTLSADDAKLYLAGDFIYLQQSEPQDSWILAQGVGVWDGDHYDNLYNEQFANGVGLFVTAIAKSGNEIYVGGTFHAAGDASANYIAKWDGQHWSGLGTGVENRTSTATPRVDAIAAHPDGIFVGGSFSHAGGVASPNVAIWTGTEWRAAGEGLNGRVHRLVLYQGNVIATGQFSASGAQTMFFVARWNGNSWEDLNACCLASRIGSQGAHEAIVADDTLYVGGALLGDGGTYTNSVFQLAQDSYVFLGGFNRAIQSMAVHNSELYVSGQFTRVNGQAITNLAKWNGSSWSAVASTLNSGVSAIAVHNDQLIIAGGFTQSTTVSNLNGIARLGASDWEPMGSGLWFSPPAGARGSDLLSAGDDLYIVGIFNRAGAVDSLNISRWNEQIDFYSSSEIRIQNVSLTTSAELSIVIDASPNTTVIIESTTDFTSWTEVTRGTGAFEATVPVNTGAAFFRARTPD
jgi:trimeric autotransporter adhesin